jgi:hypothetical protein
LNLLRDDGAVIYLNGAEVRRDNLPTGTITYTNYASSPQAKTGLAINQLLNLCVQRALPGLCADLERRPDYQQDVDWSDLLNRRQRKPKHSFGQVCKEIRALSNRR